MRTKTHNIILIFLFLFITGQNSTHSVDASNGISENWDRLLIEEVSSLNENIQSINTALDEKNYTATTEQINDIESAGNWFNVRKELESRGQINLISSFQISISNLYKSVTAKDPNSLEQAQILSQDFQNIERSLGQPVIDFQRFILVILIIGTLVTFGLHVVPAVRKKLNAKF